MDVNTFNKTCLCESLLCSRANGDTIASIMMAKNIISALWLTKFKTDAIEYTLSDLQNFKISVWLKMQVHFQILTYLSSSVFMPSSHSNRDSHSTNLPTLHHVFKITMVLKATHLMPSFLINLKFSRKIQFIILMGLQPQRKTPWLSTEQSVWNCKTQWILSDDKENRSSSKCCIRATPHIPAPTLHWADAFPQIELNLWPY